MQMGVSIRSSYHFPNIYIGGDNMDTSGIVVLGMVGVFVLLGLIAIPIASYSSKKEEKQQNDNKETK